MMDRKWCSLTFLTSICLILFLLGSYAAYEHFRRVDAREDNEKHYVTLQVEASNATGRPIPETLFGIFFEEINHAGAGGLWAELVSNRGFEAGGQIIPSSIWPWSIIGDESTISVVTDRSSCFERNKIALRMEVFCNSSGCPSEGVGVYNPGYWGMNIEEGKKYKVTLYVRSTGDIDVSVSLTSSNGSLTLASEQIIALASEVSKWTKKEMLLEANGTDDGARLQLTTTKNGSIWFDQVSAMPVDTYKGHGFRNDLFQMMVDLKPRFIRFPGGCYVEGDSLSNAFHWKETVGAWEERPGHFGDVWNYWTDDGLGHFEFFQLAEDLGAAPIWVFNSGISHHDQVETARIMPFVQEALDGIEFARGDANSTWGSVRAAMGHPKPFGLKYVAVGNEDRWQKYTYYNFDGAILGVTLALGAVRAAFKYASTSAALNKIKDAPEVSVSDLRSLIPANDDQSESSDDGNSRDQQRIVLVHGTVKPKFTGGEGSHKNNVLTSQETGDKALIIHRSQTYVYSGWKILFQLSHGHRFLLERSLPKQGADFMRMVPFVIVDNTQPSSQSSFLVVNMDGARQPLPLTTVYNRLQPINSSPYAFLQALFFPEYPVGLLDVEKILPPGRDLTAVGICSFNNGVPEIKSCPDLPYFLSEMTKDKMIMDLTETTSVIFWGGFIMGCLSAGILGFAAVRAWNRWKLRHHEREQQQRPDEQRPDQYVVADETEDEDEIPDGALCVICVTRRRVPAFIPCGHVVCCRQCASTVEREVNPKCPVCLQSIRGSMRVYYS